jgi:serine-type D-Ala-D-Ala endopeptidase (penicillin-binding protein 7)
MKRLLISLTLFASCLSYAGGSYALYNYEREEWQVSHNSQEIRSIASITKLFTAVTILRSGVDLDERVKVTGKSGGRFPRGMMVSRIDLMKAMLISSDNLAAETLANTYPGGFNTYLEDANRWITGWGLINTRVVDASGLLAGNVSSVNDLVKFLARIQDNTVIRTITGERNTTVKVPKGKKTITINLKNTNSNLFHFDNILISKTGTTNAAGRCVIMLVEKEGAPYAVVVLGQKNSQTRTALATDLITATPLPRITVVDPEPIEFKFPI